MKVVGLDLSLTSTGVAVATENGAVTDRVTSSPARRVPKGGVPLTVEERGARIRRHAANIAGHVHGDVDLVVIETPAYNQTTGDTHDRSGLWWAVVGQILTREVPVVEVATTCLKKYATGRGGAPKDDVLSAVIRRYPHVDVNGNDEADSLVLAAMGARHLGHPLEPHVAHGGRLLPLTHLAAMDAVHWPEDLGGAA